MTLSDKLKKEDPWLWRWERFKLAFTEFLARRFNIHWDW